MWWVRFSTNISNWNKGSIFGVLSPQNACTKLFTARSVPGGPLYSSSVRLWIPPLANSLRVFTSTNTENSKIPRKNHFPCGNTFFHFWNLYVAREIRTGPENQKFRWKPKFRAKNEFPLSSPIHVDVRKVKRKKGWILNSFAQGGINACHSECHKRSVQAKVLNLRIYLPSRHHIRCLDVEDSVVWDPIFRCDFMMVQVYYALVAIPNLDQKDLFLVT